MPPKPKTKDEVAFERKQILDTALDIITTQSVNDLSMRKLAKQLGYSATKLYYYFECKAEIVLALIEDGYTQLNVAIAKDLKNVSDPKERFTSLLDCIRTFSLDQSYYFNVMYGINVPKLEEIREKRRVVDNRYFENEETNQIEFYETLSSVTAEFQKKCGKEVNSLLPHHIISQLAGVSLISNTDTLKKADFTSAQLYELAKETIISSIEK